MAQENFKQALAFTLGFEGGWANNPKDPGGATMRGVTLRTYRSWHPGATAGQLRVAPMAHFEAIYRFEFWGAVGCDALPAGVDLMAFDIAVNMGPGRAKSWLVKTTGLVPAARIRELDKLRCGFWRVLRTFPVFGKGWLRRETACMAEALKLAAAKS